MAGSLAEAMAQINSLRPAALTALATLVRTAGSRSATAGRTLDGSATEVGAQQGGPYAAYRDRLAPVAGWLTRFEQPATSAAAALENAGAVASSVQSRAAGVLDSLARYGASQTDPATAGANMAQAEAQALEMLNQLIAEMTGAYAGVQPAHPGAAPVKDGGDPGADPSTARPGATLASTGSVGNDTDTAASDTTAADDSSLPSSTDRPPTGPFSGWVQDPATGNLVDPATGREVNAGGQFLDPVTGQPFGDASQYASRLEGLQGGVSPTGGLLGAGGAGSVGAFVGPVAGAGAGGGAGGGFAGLYGGMIPPSLMAGPAAGQLRAKAASNLESKAAAAQRAAAAAASGQQAHPYLPPMGGAGAGAAGAGAGRAGSRSGRRMVSEPSSVWGATGRGDRDGRKRSSTGTTEVVEDEDVWTGGEPAGSGVLG